MRIRPFAAGDERALAEICARTALHGRDARGVLTDDRMWGEVFALPYATRHPALAFIVVSDADEPLGYIVGTDDIEAFASWFQVDWWPSRRPESTAGGADEMLRHFADALGRTPHPYAESHPAELHIDLLPEAQGGGWGRALMDEFLSALRARQISGVQLGVSAVNAGAIAFYRRLGFAVLSESPETVSFGKDLRATRRE